MPGFKDATGSDDALTGALHQRFVEVVAELQSSGTSVKQFHVMSACCYLLLETALCSGIDTPEGHLDEIVKTLPAIMSDILVRDTAGTA